MDGSNKYTLLLMRDDRQVRHLRLRPFWLKLFIWMLLFLFIFAGGGIWGSYYFWNKGRADAALLAQLERQNADLSIKVERLQNMETLIGASEKAPLDPVLDTGPAETPPGDSTHASGVPAGGLPILVDVGDNSTLADNATSTVNATLTGNSTLLGNATAPEDGEVGASTPGDATPVKLENIYLRANSSKTLRLSMNFVNASGKAVRGYATLKLLTTSGEVPAIVPAEDLDFQITRMKRVTTTFPLPENVSMDSVESVRISVFVNETEVLTEEAALEK